jgi:uncharacterized protein YndB with AHSA1/START domain
MLSQTIYRKIDINAPVAAVWEALTDTTHIKQWMLDSEIEIITDWKVGSPMFMRGDLGNLYFENRGVVLQYEPEKVLEYTYLSSLSMLPDTPENYCSIEFNLASVDNHTTLAVSISNFPTETIAHHADFYWRTAIVILKEFVEKKVSS